MALGEVGRAEILRAVEEFERLGRAGFLERYGFEESRRYVLVVDGRRYDSKAVVGAAHGFLPGREPLAASEFSGGRGHAVKLLADLGFRVAEQEAVPEVTAAGLAERIGALRVAYADGGPRLHQPITLLWAIGRALRGEPRLVGWDETGAELGGLLARRGRPGERSRPDYPVLALHRAGLWDLHGYEGAVPAAHGDAVPRRWFEEQRPLGGLVEPVHELVRASGPARVAAIQAITERFFDGFDEVPLLEDVGLYDECVAASPGSPVDDPVVLAAEYERLCHLAERGEQARRGKRRETVSQDPVRSPWARAAVLARCDSRCENPGCGGQPDDVTDGGAPILEVDHIVGLADDGPDLPRQMIALCPNCHAVKTRGRTRHELCEVLLKVAAERHGRLIAPLP